MPQLDTTWFLSQFFWLCICFFTMLFLVSKIFVPRIKEVLELRQRKIDNYLVRAHQLKEQAEESLKKYQDALAKATEDANEALSLSRQEMNDYVNKKQEDLTQKLQAKLTEGEAHIAEVKAKALKEMEGQAQEWAVEVIAKLGLAEFDSKDVKQSIKQVLKK